jgi:hypothetical protein
MASKRPVNLATHDGSRSWCLVVLGAARDEAEKEGTHFENSKRATMGK